MEIDSDFRSRNRATLDCSQLPTEYRAARTLAGAPYRLSVRQTRALGALVMLLSWQAAMVATYVLVGAWLIYLL